MKRLIAIFALACLVLAPASIVAQPQQDPPAAEVIVLNPGEGELATLRWKPETDRVSRMRMTVDMGMDITIDGEPAPDSDLPPFAFEMAMQAGPLNPEGVYPVRATYEKVMIPGDRGDERTRTALLDALEPLEGVEIRFTLDQRGVLRSLDLDGVPNSVLAMLGGEAGARRMVESFGNPLPRDPVGVGAQWQSIQTIRADNAPQLKSTTTYTLASRDGDRIVLLIQGTQSGENQRFKTGAGGLDAELKDATGAYSGELELRLDRLTPIRSWTRGSTTFRFAYLEDGAERTIEQTVRMRVEVEQIEE